MEPIYDAQIDLYNKWLENKDIVTKVKFNFIGDRDILPQNYVKKIDALERVTKKNTKQCNILVAYNGQWEY